MEKWPAKLAIGTLVVTILPWQYGVYMLGKVIVFGVALYYVTRPQIKNQEGLKWAMVILAILYNPLLPVYLYLRGLWIIVDIISILIFSQILMKLGKSFHS